MVVFAPAAAADTTLAFCDLVTPAPPCVVSLQRNGLDIPYNAAPGGADDVVYATKFHITGDPTKHFYFNIAAPDGSWTLDTSDTYEISLNLGTADPGETFERGHDVTITRDLSDPNNQIITFVQNPVLTADQGCNSIGSCDPVAGRTLTGYADGWIDDLAYIDDPLDRASMRGYDFATNADWSSDAELRHAHVHPRHRQCPLPARRDDSVHGSAEFRFPFAMLSRLYEVDDPASLTAGSFTISGTGAAATTLVDIDSGGHVVHVAIEGMTFSKHRLRITGDMRPGGVRHLKATRVSRTVGKLRFDPAKSRGSKVRGYKATCRSDSGLVAGGSANDSPLKVTGLSPGVKYRCTIWAKSRFGDGAKRGVDLPRS